MTGCQPVWDGVNSQSLRHLVNIKQKIGVSGVTNS